MAPFSALDRTREISFDTLAEQPKKSFPLPTKAARTVYMYLTNTCRHANVHGLSLLSKTGPTA
jgi:hypothetical protein